MKNKNVFYLAVGTTFFACLLSAVFYGPKLVSSLPFFRPKSATTIPVFLGKRTEYEEYQALYAKVNEQTYTIIDVEQKIPAKLNFDSIMYINLIDKQDFDSDGYTDYLVELDMGGNACMPGYAFVSVFPDGSSTVSSEFGACEGGEKRITKNGRTGIQIEGSQGPTTNYFYKNGNVISEVLPKPSVLTAEKDINFRALDNVEGITKYWDLNDDGINEKIKCDIVRSGLICSIFDQQDQKITFPYLDDRIIRRIGLLIPITNGYHDLVIDDQDIYRWNGSSYAKGLQTDEAKPSIATSTDQATSLPHNSKENSMEQNGSVVMFLIMGILGLVGIGVYCLPTILAVVLKNKNIMAIAIINLLLGWVGIGWIVALIMAVWRREAPVQPVIYQGVQVATPPIDQHSSS